MRVVDAVCRECGSAYCAWRNPVACIHTRKARQSPPRDKMIREPARAKAISRRGKRGRQE